MSQRDTLRALDAMLVAACAAAGVADAATYDGQTTCTALIDREQAFYGDDPQVIVGVRTVARLQLAEVPEPRRGKRLELTETGERFRLGAELERDESSVLVELVPPL